MKKLAYFLTVFVVTMLASPGLVLAEDVAIQTMARITMNLNHFPSDQDKVVLQGIIDSDDTTDEEADIAMAIVNIEHKVQDKDVERLTDIVDDDNSPADARSLASIVLRINHSPSDADRTTLAALAKDQ